MTDSNLPVDGEPTSRLSGLVNYLRVQPKWLVASLGAVTAAIIAVAGILVWYVIVRAPITDLPGVEVNTPPGFAYNIPGPQRPLGIAYDQANDRLYVAQSEGTGTVAVFKADGTPLGELKAPLSTERHTSVYVAVKPETADVYVVDRGTMQVLIYDSTGKLTGELKPSEKHWTPLAIAFSPDGKKTYVSDTNATTQRILVFAEDGSVIQTIGEKDKLQFPNGLVVQQDGSLAVADSNNSRVIVYNADGTVRGFLTKGDSPSQIGMPRGLAIGVKDRLYIADTIGGMVRVYKWDDFSGVPVYSTEFGEVGQEDGQFIYPNAVAVDTTGLIFVTDRTNNRVSVWKNR